MKFFFKIIIVAAALLIPTTDSFSQNPQIYKHSSLNIQFEASQNWLQVPHPEDELIYEMVDPDSVVHVVLWYTETEQDALSYLMKMADMKDLRRGSLRTVKLGYSMFLVMKEISRSICFWLSFSMESHR